MSADTYHMRPPRRPSLRFLLSHPVHLIAFGFGSGLSRFGPGTLGTLVAIPIFAITYPRLSDGWYALLLVAAFLGGIWTCERTSRALGVHDHGGIVVDEIVAFMIVLVMIPHTLGWQVSGFLLFRLFDIWKPFPITWCDGHLKGGFGVMFDDILAAGYSLLCLWGVSQWL